MDESKINLSSLLTPSTSDRKVPQNVSDPRLPRVNVGSSFSEVLSPTVSTHFRQKVSKKVPFWDPLINSQPRDFAKLWNFSEIGQKTTCFPYL